ncbi:hypothetical protein [Clostridium intestinale]|uniref:Uncharacterized protein n=1 Tax=Clostridium intestinale DSM 6191 TaxID=1121320 RepID=A0A1M5ZMH4_9CLOT|nr:hypothetical protein [Clostridium intestinale]SHI25376.1 hypothetical protein SAMN02745941_03156 [Clostridium intestinale DSM 6191]
MEVKVFLIGRTDPIIYKADRIDVLDFELNGIKYKQIRCFKGGFSKSELLKSDLIKEIK